MREPLDARGRISRIPRGREEEPAELLLLPGGIERRPLHRAHLRPNPLAEAGYPQGFAATRLRAHSSYALGVMPAEVVSQRGGCWQPFGLSVCCRLVFATAPLAQTENANECREARATRQDARKKKVDAARRPRRTTPNAARTS